jgi:hypothetical protein
MDDKEARTAKYLRLPDDLVREIQALADEREVSFNKATISVLRKGLAK